MFTACHESLCRTTDLHRTVANSRIIVRKHPGRHNYESDVQVHLLRLQFQDELGLDRHVIAVGMLVRTVSDTRQEVLVAGGDAVHHLDMGTFASD